MGSRSQNRRLEFSCFSTDYARWIAGVCLCRGGRSMAESKWLTERARRSSQAGPRPGFRRRPCRAAGARQHPAAAIGTRWRSRRHAVHRTTDRCPVPRWRPMHRIADQADLRATVFRRFASVKHPILHLHKMFRNGRLQPWPGFDPVHRGGPKGRGGLAGGSNSHDEGYFLSR